MIKNFRWLIFMLAPILLLNGCSLIPGQSQTEVVFQEKKQINDLQDFAQEAQKIAIDKIGPNVKLKRVNFSYPATGDYVSYNAFFQSDGIFSNGVTKHLIVTYNQKYEKTNKTNLAWSFADRDNTPSNNGELVGTECNLSKDCQTMTFYPNLGDINIEDLKISVADLVKKYPIEVESGSDRLGMILIPKDVLKGIYGHYRFKPATGEVALVEDINEAQWFTSDIKTYNPVSDNSASSTSATTISTSTAEILARNFNNDYDKDGLTNLQEAGYGTDPSKADTDDDGNTDSEEINNGYNPLGSGKLISDDCVKNSETDKCYLEIAKAKKDVSLCQKISTKKLVFECLSAVNLITKNPQICEEPNNASENDIPDFYNTCLKELISIANPVVHTFDRDIRTIDDVKQIQTGLELYYNDNFSYPTSLEIMATGTRRQMSVLPIAIKGKSDICSKNYDYKYTFISGDNYSLSYCVDSTSTIDSPYHKFNLGVNIASPKGF